MSKAPTPRADALQAQRVARYGHLQATAEPSKIDRPIPIKSPATARVVPAKKEKKR